MSAQEGRSREQGGSCGKTLRAAKEGRLGVAGEPMTAACEL